MTKMNAKECRFCLKIIYGNKFHIMSEIVTQMLNTLLKANLNIDREAVMCLECATKLQSAVDFKTICLSARSKVNFKVNRKQNTGIEFADISRDQKVCQFCMSLTERGRRCTDLEDMIDMVQKYVSELHLNIAEEHVICDACLFSLRNLLNFVKLCSETEKRETNRKAAGRREDNYNSIERITVKNELESEDNVEIDNLNVNNTSEEMNIKLEQVDCEGPAADTSTPSPNISLTELSDQIAAAGPSETWSWELYNMMQRYRPPNKCETQLWKYRIRLSNGKRLWVKVRPRRSISVATNEENSDLVALEQTIAHGSIPATASTSCTSPMDTNLASTTPPPITEKLVHRSPFLDPYQLSVSNEDACTRNPQPPGSVHRSVSSKGVQCYLNSAPPQIDTTSRGTQYELIL